MGYIRCGGGKVEPPVTEVLITAKLTLAGTAVGTNTGSYKATIPFTGSGRINRVDWGPQHTDSGNIAGNAIVDIISVVDAATTVQALSDMGATEEEIERVVAAEPGTFVLLKSLSTESETSINRDETFVE